MNPWDLVDIALVVVGVVWLAWSWYSVSTTILDPAYPKAQHLQAYLHILRGCLLMSPVIVILVLQRLLTGRP
jgi:hypothetical protein